MYAPQFRDQTVASKLVLAAQGGKANMDRSMALIRQEHRDLRSRLSELMREEQTCRERIQEIEAVIADLTERACRSLAAGQDWLPHRIARLIADTANSLADTETRLALLIERIAATQERYVRSRRILAEMARLQRQATEILAEFRPCTGDDGDALLHAMESPAESAECVHGDYWCPSVCGAEGVMIAGEVLHLTVPEDVMAGIRARL